MRQLVLLLSLLLAQAAAAQTYTGTLNSSSPTFSHPAPNGNNAPISLVTGSYYYNIISLKVLAADTYTFRGVSFISGGTLGILDQNSFLPATPLVTP